LPFIIFIIAITLLSLLTLLFIDYADHYYAISLILIIPLRHYYIISPPLHFITPSLITLITLIIIFNYTLRHLLDSTLLTCHYYALFSFSDIIIPPWHSIFILDHLHYTLTYYILHTYFIIIYITYFIWHYYYHYTLLHIDIIISHFYSLPLFRHYYYASLLLLINTLTLLITLYITPYAIDAFLLPFITHLLLLRHYCHYFSLRLLLLSLLAIAITHIATLLTLLLPLLITTYTLHWYWHIIELFITCHDTALHTPLFDARHCSTPLRHITALRHYDITITRTLLHIIHCSNCHYISTPLLLPAITPLFLLHWHWHFILPY